MYNPDWKHIIHTKNGKAVIARPHEATFKGCHNSSKSKALIILYHRKHKLLQTTGLTLKELSIASGSSYAYLKSRLAKWVEWKYITRKITVGTNRPVYSYSIVERGEHFVEDRIPKDRLAEYIEEIRTNKLGGK
jgi:hypothetical protein